jgi:uncharacterized protein
MMAPRFLPVLTFVLLAACSDSSSNGDLYVKYYYETQQPEVQGHILGDNVRIGKWTWWRNDGSRRLEGTYLNGIQDGVWTDFDERGREVRRTAFAAGVPLEAARISWYENGQKEFEGAFKDNERDGLTIQWYDNGQKMREIQYRMGRQVSSTWWTESGLRSGLFTVKYKGGQTMVEGQIKDGKKEGLWRYWKESGKLENEDNWKGGVRDGQ